MLLLTCCVTLIELLNLSRPLSLRNSPDLAQLKGTFTKSVMLVGA